MDFLRTVLFLPPGASTVADDLDLLHAVVISTTLLGTLAVFLTAAVFVLRFPRSRRTLTTPRVEAPLWRDLLVAGALLALFVGFWVVGFRQYVRMREVPEGAYDVYAVGKQWIWKFSYPEGRSSVGVLVAPVGHPVRVVLTSRDVIHSFYVPAFRLKQDAVPGHYSQIWFEATQTGRFPLYCAEYCGESHSRMWADVVVLEPAAFERWLDGETPPLVAEALANRARTLGRLGAWEGQDETMVEAGRRVAESYGCLACHTVDGQPHVGPSWAGLYGRVESLASGEAVLVDEEYLTESMMVPDAKRVAGFEAVMPTYRGVLDGVETTALLAFIKSLRDVVPAPAVELPPVDPRVPGEAGGSSAAAAGAGGPER